MAVWTRNQYARTRAYVPMVPKAGTIVEASETAHVVSGVGETSDAYTVAQNTSWAVFRFLRLKGKAKDVSAEGVDDARADGAIAAWALASRYARRYGAVPAYDRRQLMRTARRAVERALDHERAECHESIDAPKHAALESPTLSLEQSAVIHESLEEALNMRLDWPMSDDTMAWLERQADSNNRRSAAMARERSKQLDAVQTA